jgi:hypothetical protein
MNTSRLLASRNLDAGRQIHAGRRQVARAFDNRLQLGFALAGDGNLRAQFVARRTELVVDVAA